MSHDDASATIDAWRERGADRHDPVRFRFIESLAQRTVAHSGAARRILDDKLARLLAGYGEALDRASAEAETDGAQTSRASLTELVDHLARHAPTAAEPAALRYVRSTWSRLSAERRLVQSLAKVPENAGPLNSQLVVHRSLALMRELSPEYLHRFMSYVDALSWIDQFNGASAPVAGNTPRAERARKTPRGKAS